jgi:hypothetical protein
MERAVLQRLAHRARTSAAAVVRRLIWREAERSGLMPPDDEDTLPLKVKEANIGS